MIRARRIVGISVALFVLLTAGARAASPYAKATLSGCDRVAHEATFEGRMVTVRRAVKMQMRFTLQAKTPEEPEWSRVVAAGFGEWITAPPVFGKYTYDKTVEHLLAGGNYRAAIDFRWRDRRGKTVRTERAISPVCRQPDSRADLVVRDLDYENGEYIAVLFNRGRQAAGAFKVDFLVDGVPLGTADAVGLAPQTSLTVLLSGPACAPGTEIEAVSDARSQVDESDEENDSLSAFC